MTDTSAPETEFDKKLVQTLARAIFLASKTSDDVKWTDVKSDYRKTARRTLRRLAEKGHTVNSASAA